MANVIVNNIGDLNGALAEANASTTTPFQIQFGSDITGSPTVEVAGTIIQIVGNGHTFDANGGILLLIGPFGGVVDFDNTLAITLGGNEEEVGGQGTVTIAGVISDQTGSVGSLTINPVPIADPVVLSAVNTYTGGTTIESGTLQLTAGATAGSGPITFGSLGVGRFLPTLQIDAPVSGNQMFTNTLVNMMVGDRIDLLGVPFGTAQPVMLTSFALMVQSANGTETFRLQNPATTSFSASSDGGGGTLVTMTPTVGNMTPAVGNIAELNAAILAADSITTPGVYQIVFANDISLGTTALAAINLQPGVVLDISGDGHALDGGGTQPGLFVYAGTVGIDTLAINNMLARGGNGGSGTLGGGGGGAGLGGGLFVGANANVSVEDVTFATDGAAGGNGGDGGPSR